MKRTIIAVCLLLAVAGFVYGMNYVDPIVNISQAQTTVSRQEAKWIYTIKVKYWPDGQRVTVYHLPYDSQIHQNFVSQVLEMSPSVFLRHVQLNINAGSQKHIREVKNLDAMFEAVQSTPGAIGYLSKDFLIVNGRDHVNLLKITD